MTGLAELRLVPRGSHATLDVDVRRDGAGTVGHVDATVGGAPDGSSAALHATFRGRRVSARARVALGALGWVELRRAELELPGGLSLDAAERATGALDLEGALDLAQVAPLLGAEGVERIAGTAALSARIERGDERLPPTVRATATTRGLDLSLYRDGRSVHAGGIDGSVHLEHDGVTQATELSAGAWDASGPLASADGKASVPVLGWALGQASLDRRALAAVAVSARVDVPARAIAELPGLLERPDLPGLLASTDLPGLVARPDLRGRVEAHAELHGSLDRPDVVVSARADALRVKRPRGRARMLPVDATLDARWNGTDVVATLRLDEEERAERGPSGAGTAARTSGHVRGLVLAKLPVAELLAGRPLAWDASGALDVADLELAPLPLPEDLEGTLTGRVELRDLASAPRLLARAHVDDLGVSGARVAKADLEVTASDGSLAGHATLHQADGGSADAALLSSALSWRGLTATWDEAQPSRVDYKVSAMRLGLVRPFVRTIFPEIDGRIDGSGSAVVGPASQVFEGGLSLSEGRLYATAFGEEITDLEGAATFDRDGAFRVQGVRGKIGAGVLTASASGRMKGLRFASAEVVAVVPTKDGVPLSAEGANFAEATGEVRMRASMAPDRKALLVAVDVPRATVTLPDRGTQRLQPLDLDTSIVVGVRRPDGTLTPEVARRGRRQADKSAEAQADSLTARLTVTLGDDVRLEGRGLAIGLGGRTLVDVADELAVTGRITLKTGGTVDVQGRRFVIDHGTLTFVEGSESTNPTVVGAASWDAPDGTRVWVEFNGPLETGKLTLRSEPPYSKNEILSVLLFGRPDPNQARAGDARPSEADTAAAVGSGLVSSGLNKALGELDDDFELEQDRTSANRLRTNLGYKLRRNLKVKVGYASGLSQREPDTTYLFLEWLFLPKWSLLGTRGDKGTSILDVLFQHRY
jgi:translocation and assembly module TamB